jgi:phospholipid/cholesterol/gamma-HCH transport system substrate-binding protein
MDERVLQFRIGLFLLIAMLILVILIVYNTEGWSSQYTVHVKPQTAPGVAAGTPVRKNGIRIGRVSKVKTQDDHVALTLKINQDERIFDGEICSIGAESFLGDSVIEIVPVGKETRGSPLAEGGLMNKVSVKRNPMELIDVAINLEDQIEDTLETIRQAGIAVDEAGQGISAITGQVNNAMADEDSDLKKALNEFREMSQKAQLALDSFNRVFESVNNVVGDPALKTKVNDALAELPTIFEELRSTVRTTKETIDSFKSVSGSASTNLENLESFTASLKSEGPEILSQVNSSLKNIDELVAQVKDFAKNLEDFDLKLPDFNEGSIGKLLNETELYDNANEAVANFRDVTARLEPLMDDLRLFGDTLARSPGSIIKDAVKNKPPNTGYKPHLRGNFSPREARRQDNNVFRRR